MNTKYLTQAAIIAALYVGLTHLSNLFGLASGLIQVRLSEILTILPIAIPAAIPGLFIGCILANLSTGALIMDILFGSLATLLAAILTRKLGKRSLYFGPIPPIVFNAVIVGLILKYVYRIQGALAFFMLTVGLGELISAGILGIIFYKLLQRRAIL